MKNVVVTASSKYQVVIPKAARQKMGLTKGSRLTVTHVSDHAITLSKQPTAQETVDKYADSLSDVWGDEDPAITIRRMRDKEWD